MVAVRRPDRLARSGDGSIVIENLEESRGGATVRAMRPLFMVVLCALAAAAGAFTGAGSAGVHGSPARVVLNTHDRFDLARTHVVCRVSRRGPGFANRLVCFRELKPLSNRAGPGTYAVELQEGAVVVARVGSKGSVFNRPELAPAGPPAGSASATAVLGGSIDLATRQDKAFVAGTNIVCRPFGSPRPTSVLCVLLGSDGHVHDGTYLVIFSDHGVLIGVARNGKAVTVFRRVHGR
jgi:hypothetical protein